MLSRLNIIILSVFAFLLPVFFLPLTSEYYQYNKQVLVILVALISFLLFLAGSARRKKLTLRLSHFDLPLIFLLSAAIVSTIFSAANKYEALVSPLGIVTIFASILLYFVLREITRQEIIFISFLLGAVALSLLSVFERTGLLKILNPHLFSLPYWTPTGNPLLSLSFLAVILSMLATSFWQQIENKINISLLITVGLILLLCPGAIIFLYAYINGAFPPILPPIFGWNIAIDTLKTPLQFFMGVGPGNFFPAFTHSKPIAFNLTPYWTLAFNSSSNFYFQILTELGILGFLSYLYLAALVVKEALASKLPEEKPLYVGAVTILLVQLFIPTDTLILVSLLLILSMVEMKHHKILHPDLSSLGQSFWAIFGLGVILAGGVFYLVGRAYLGEIYFKSSLDATLAKNGQSAYNNQLTALRVNNYHYRYHMAFAQTNLALANTLSQRAGKIENDKENITRAVQSAINEAKTAVSLDVKNADTWNNLASIYRGIINYADGAKEWTIAAYRQTIVLDPANPLPRLNLGGVLYFSGQYQDAENLFRQAIILKPDWANFHYNLAAALKAEKKYDEAVSELNATLTLLNPGSDDYRKAGSEAAELKKLLPSNASNSAALQPNPAAQSENQSLYTANPAAPSSVPDLNLQP